MTEQEAIKEFEERLATTDYRDNIPKYYEAMELAVKDMKEVQQYRAIGTPDECKKNVFLILDAYKKGIDNFAELLTGKLVQKYANARPEQQYVALQVTDWCEEIAEKLKGAFDDVET